MRTIILDDKRIFRWPWLHICNHTGLFDKKKSLLFWKKHYKYSTSTVSNKKIKKIIIYAEADSSKFADVDFHTKKILFAERQIIVNLVRLWFFLFFWFICVHFAHLCSFSSIFVDFFDFFLVFVLIFLNFFLSKSSLNSKMLPHKKNIKMGKT